jgi:hypothetical protein
VILRRGAHATPPVQISGLEGDFNADSLLKAVRVTFPIELSDVGVSDIRAYTDVSLTKQLRPNDFVTGGTFDNPLCINAPGAALQRDICVHC